MKILSEDSCVTGFICGNKMVTKKNTEDRLLVTEKAVTSKAPVTAVSCCYRSDSPVTGRQPATKNLSSRKKENGAGGLVGLATSTLADAAKQSSNSLFCKLGVLVFLLDSLL